MADIFPYFSAPCLMTFSGLWKKNCELSASAVRTRTVSQAMLFPIWLGCKLFFSQLSTLAFLCCTILQVWMIAFVPWHMHSVWDVVVYHEIKSVKCCLKWSSCSSLRVIFFLLFATFGSHLPWSVGSKQPTASVFDNFCHLSLLIKKGCGYGEVFFFTRLPFQVIIFLENAST